MSQALHTDHYELTMLDALVLAGQADRESVFEVFAREIPLGRPYGVLCGNGRLIESVRNFIFGDEELDFLESQKIISRKTLYW